MSEAQKEAVARSARQNDEIEIDLGKVLEAIKQYWAILLAATLICGIIGFLVSNYGMTKKYIASVDMIVNTSSDADLVSNDQVNSAKNLVSTYSFIITGSNVLTQVVENLGLDMTYEELAKIISVDSVTDTQVFTVSAVTTDVETSKKIVQEIGFSGRSEVHSRRRIRRVASGTGVRAVPSPFQNVPRDGKRYHGKPRTSCPRSYSHILNIML